MTRSALNARLTRIEATRRLVLERAVAMTPERLTARPGQDRWSILDILEHLVLAERDVFGDLAAAGARQPQRRRVRDHVSFVIVMAVLRFGIPVKAPSRGMLPTGGRTLDELRQSWEEHHRQLRALVDGNDRTVTGKAIFRHPVAGPLTMCQALAMLDVHLERHRRQIGALEER